MNGNAATQNNHIVINGKSHADDDLNNNIENGLNDLNEEYKRLAKSNGSVLMFENKKSYEEISKSAIYKFQMIIEEKYDVKLGKLILISIRKCIR